SRSTARPSRRLATYASPLRIGALTLPQAAGNDERRAGATGRGIRVRAAGRRGAGTPPAGAPVIRDNVRHREASAPRRRAGRPRDAGVRRDGRRRDVPAQARDPALRGRPRRRQSRGARLLGLSRVRRGGARSRDLHRRGRPLVLPPSRRGRRSRPVLREHAGRGHRSETARTNRPLCAADPGRTLPAGLSRLRRRRTRDGTRRWNRAGRALDPHPARGLGDRGARRPVACPRAPSRMTEVDSPTWRVPPRWVLLVAVLSIVAAEVGGGAMARFKVELTRWARDGMLARPSVHGLVGVRDVDERILDEALVKFDAGLRLLHMHAEGMGLVIIATSMVAATVIANALARRVIIALLTAGGAGYPVGYLAWSALIPSYGLERSKVIAEWLVWVPFGTATIVALWCLAGFVA